jgi:hypothetical protein
MKRLSITSMALVVTLWCTWVQSAVIQNGDFSVAGIPANPFAVWTTDDSLFDRPADGGGFALFGDTSAVGSSQLAQSFGLPNLAQSLSFEINICRIIGGSTGGPSDSFQATLFDSMSTELFPSNAPLFTSFYSVDNDGAIEFFDPLFVTSTDLGGGFKRITLNLSSLAPQNLVIDFLLNGSDDGFSTRVGLDNVVVNQASVPEPGAILLWLILGGTVYVRRRSRKSPTDREHESVGGKKWAFASSVPEPSSLVLLASIFVFTVLRNQTMNFECAAESVDDQ